MLICTHTPVCIYCMYKYMNIKNLFICPSRYYMACMKSRIRMSKTIT